ncbi:MAG: hypothetical protein M0R80_00970 [Proteobacteria bacterium]|jgi:hypothetical protein|nr:hypothetical protein [Pseudomonadota bacterium]
MRIDCNVVIWGSQNAVYSKELELEIIPHTGDGIVFPGMHPDVAGEDWCLRNADLLIYSPCDGKLSEVSFDVECDEEGKFAKIENILAENGWKKVV